MPVRFLVIKASPRSQGNSSLLADVVAQAARETGATVETVTLQDMNIQPCDACEACLGGNNCAIGDDMQLLYPRLLNANAILLASPIYWAGFSAQLKLMIDRFYMPYNADSTAFHGKVFGVVLTYADANLQESGGFLALDTLKFVLRFIGADYAGCVHASADKAGEVKTQPERISQAAELGRVMALWQERKEPLPLAGD